MALKIEYKAETEDDMADMLQSLLMVRSTAFMAQKFVKTLKMPEGYYVLQEAFDAILMFIEPAMTHISNEMMSKQKKPRVKKSA
jgi:hypothetical protein